MRAPGRAKGKWAGQGRERFLGEARQRVGGARAVGGVGSLPRREGEGQPGEVGSGPGEGSQRKGPRVPLAAAPAPRHVVHSCEHGTRWARHPRCQANHQPGASPPPVDPGSRAVGPGPVPGCPGRSRAPGASRQCIPCPTRDPAPCWAAPSTGLGRGGACSGRAARVSGRGRPGTQLRRGAVGLFRAGRSGHASSLGTSLGRGKGEAEASPAGCAHPAHGRGGAGGTKGRPPERSPPRRGSKLSPYKSSSRKIPREVPAAEGWGSDRAATPRPAALGRGASACPAHSSNFRPSSRRQGGTPIGTRRPLGRVGVSHCEDWPGRVPANQWRQSLSSATPLLQRRARHRSIPPVRAPGSPPLRVRGSPPPPPPPVTCAARMWLGADVGSRCGPGPAHPRGRAAHTEPRRARLLSRLPQCAARLRPRLGAVVPNVAARHP